MTGDEEGPDVPAGTEETEVPERRVSVVVESSDLSAASVATASEESRVQPEHQRTVALTLGSGGARGYAHIGAIEILLERGYRIVAVSGCSMGALIGGFHAAGKLQDYKDWVTGLGQFDVLKLLDVTFSSVGAIRGEKVFSIVREMLGDIRIEDLPIAYTAVATDLLAHKEVWFQEGPLDQAIRASVAIPGVVTPLVLNGRVLVDGALLNPLPIIPTISAHADLIVAVNLSGEDDQRQRIPDAAFVTGHESGREIDEWVDVLREKASRWFDWESLKSLTSRRADPDTMTAEQKLEREVRRRELRRRELDKPAPEPDASGERKAAKGAAEEREVIDWDKLGIGKFDVMNLSIETMQSALIQYKIAGYPPDLLVNIPKNACRSYDYHKAPELIQLGRERMAAALDRYERHRTSSGPLAV
ncbi:patatin-like phospholipase family protein [Marinobacter lutaoensis]|jgi:NTE family protein|uniref:patatin-like phospholipase family protein n=1 Tax=Marinobacter lutaoensis TaxID=135739 RepID=UPI000C656A03|nr:patatin-like phospholipase family protein [Marinobacter lutaoensis]MBI42799.1 alpha/beta hydrolase [Oceanospirillales bacterium]NVD35140.1 patatin-like phospholipase family protein [Marinobacter lutaoensis]|tara:strand:- start:728 stop:1978 length:1251 start_codon:yes stop_codon:yes gene_type:complete